jgi:hypothetical protein
VPGAPALDPPLELTMIRLKHDLLFYSFTHTMKAEELSEWQQTLGSHVHVALSIYI